MRYHLGTMKYQAILPYPCAKLGIRCSDDALLGLEFLPLSTATLAANNALSREVCAQLLAYLRDPATVFDLPLALRGTPHQNRVWHALLAIPRGETRSYGELAKNLGSAAQAVGQACGANPIALVVPCHRVVGKRGLGGFMHRGDGAELDIKRWLLNHEQH